MKKVMAGPLRWLFKSAPGVALLVIAAGVGVGYAANNDKGSGTETQRAPGAGVRMELPAPPPGFQELSEEDRGAMRAFGECMQANAPQPGHGGRPPDPAEGKEAFEAAFDTCKAKLTDSLRQKFEQNQAQEERFRACMEDNGAPQPPAPPAEGKRPERPSSDQLQALRKALKACEQELPKGAHGFVGPGPGGPHGSGGRDVPAPDVLIGPGGPGGHPGPPPFGPPPPPGAYDGPDGDSKG